MTPLVRVAGLRRLLLVAALALALAGCDSAADRVEAQRLEEANERIVALESELAGSGRSGSVAEREHATRWEERTVPKPFRDGRSGFDRPDRLLATLSAELIDLRPAEGGTEAVLRLRTDGDRLLGHIVVDELPDDSVRAYEFRAVLSSGERGWHVARLAMRQICRRGGSRTLCN